jgi:hypothetical protein
MAAGARSGGRSGPGRGPRDAPVVAAAAGQVDAAHERDAAPGLVRAVDDQQLLVVAAEAAHPLVGHQLPAGPVDHGAEDPVGVLVEVDQRRVRAPQQPADADAVAGQPGQERAELGARAVQLAGGVDAPVGQVQPVAGVQAGEQPMQPREVGRPVDVHRHPVAGRPGVPVAVLAVDAGPRVAPLVAGQQPVGRAVSDGDPRPRERRPPRPRSAGRRRPGGGPRRPCSPAAGWC